MVAPGALSAIVNSVVYAIYVFIFFPCIYVMIKRKTEGLKWNLSLTFLLFVSISAMLMMEVAFFMGWKDVANKGSVAVHVSEFLVLFSHILADLIILRRCYIVWNRRKDIMYLPLVLLATTIGVGIVSAVKGNFATCSYCVQKDNGFLYAFYVVSFTTNFTVTCLTAGRIYYLTREGKNMLGEEIRSRYMMICIMILESGLIYSLAILCFLILLIIGHSKHYRRQKKHGEVITSIRSVAQVVILPVITQIAGITPTLLLLRAGLMQKKTTQLNNSVGFVAPSSGKTWKNSQRSFSPTASLSTVDSTVLDDDTFSVLDIRADRAENC